MDVARLGTVIRAVRLKKGWRQEDVARRAHVSRPAVSRIERGRSLELGIRDLAAVAAALDIQLKLTPLWRGGELDRLINARHSALSESVAVWLLGWHGWDVAPEVSFSVFGERGVVDLVAWHAAAGTLLIIELKTEIVDVNDLLGRIDIKRRLAGDIGKSRGWRPRHIGVWVIVADGSTNRRTVTRHATAIRTALPARGQAMLRWMMEPTSNVSGLSFWSNARGANASAGFATVKRVRPKARRTG